MVLVYFLADFKCLNININYTLYFSADSTRTLVVDTMVVYEMPLSTFKLSGS